MAIKTWELKVYYGNVNPLYVRRSKVYTWRTMLFEHGFTIDMPLIENMVEHKDSTIRWVVSHPTNEYALEELLLVYGDKLLPVTVKEIENV